MTTKNTLTKTEIENIANGYLMQCFNNGTYGNCFAPEYINYLQAEQYILINF